MKWISYFLIFFANYSYAFSDRCEDYFPMSTRLEGGKEIKLLLPGSKVFKSPSWSPASGEPPFSISSVFQSVTNWAADTLTRYDSVAIDSIALKKYGCSSDDPKEYWYYIVEYSPSIEGNRFWGSGNWVAVLMSGEVIEPVRK